MWVPKPRKQRSTEKCTTLLYAGTWHVYHNCWNSIAPLVRSCQNLPCSLRLIVAVTWVTNSTQSRSLIREEKEFWASIPWSDWLSRPCISSGLTTWAALWSKLQKYPLKEIYPHQSHNSASCWLSLNSIDPWSPWNHCLLHLIPSVQARKRSRLKQDPWN